MRQVLVELLGRERLSGRPFERDRVEDSRLGLDVLDHHRFRRRVGPGRPGTGIHTRRRRRTTTTEEAQRINELEREVRELRRANEILKSASTFFAAELDRPSRR